jgi:hypothetical protein
MPGPKRRSFLETQWSWHLSDTEKPLGHEVGFAQNGHMAAFCSFYGHEGKSGMVCSSVQFFLVGWTLVFSQEWWGRIRYGVHGSLAACRWWELVASRLLGLNW